MQIAAFSLAEVTYATGADVGFQVQESVKNARFRIRTRQENVSGVFLPQFESVTKDEHNDFGLTGLGKGGQQVQRCRETYSRAVETLVELASLQTAFVILDETIKIVNRRGTTRCANEQVDVLTQAKSQRYRACDNTENRKYYQMYDSHSLSISSAWVLTKVQISTPSSMSLTEKSSTDLKR